MIVLCTVLLSSLVGTVPYCDYLVWKEVAVCFAFYLFVTYVLPIDVSITLSLGAFVDKTLIFSACCLIIVFGVSCLAL